MTPQPTDPGDSSSKVVGATKLVYVRLYRSQAETIAKISIITSSHNGYFFIYHVGIRSSLAGSLDDISNRSQLTLGLSYRIYFSEPSRPDTYL
ncbi:hypothetical protein DSO57_1033806 [Entomophthora muscae]|uniref:Uncharacterized protein n=1 Tax=Entomophthora muscae TaxID=34485 RepID=A0ACC2SDE9_9FUNG|nr:hypothetical protein DSO57_1033806 [Entomophthora muscae]